MRVSVVIPTYNEEKNIPLLIKRLLNSLIVGKIKYELIFVDDHSSDGTRSAIVKHSSQDLPLKLYLKDGKKGKAYSVIQGIKNATYENVAMIDADLQYPPEKIPLMLKKLEEGFDLVVADRKKAKISFARRIVSKSYDFFFNKLLHNLSVDVQSGLKVFKKKVVENIELQPSAWTLDLELLLHAKSQGYKITSIPIDFKERIYGKSNVNLIKTSAEIGLFAIKKRFFFEHKPIWFTNKSKEVTGFLFRGKEYVTHTKLEIEGSAFFTTSRAQIWLLTLGAGLVSWSLFIDWRETLIFLIGIATTIYFGDILFNLYLILRSFIKNPEIKVDIINKNNAYWPKYTILCPLYKEWQVLPQFVDAINKLDYPKEKLQVLLLLEEDDKETIIKAQETQLPSHFEILVVPHSYPKTKPKACNYGLHKATGKYTVIYDAEDVPEPDQLKKTVLAFKDIEKDVVCMQAKLNFYNPHQNLLTRLFTAEYSLWFDLILPGLQTINAPIPLGGTSNHFKTEKLKEICGWDPFNVTEDCDLGIRLAKKGYKTAIIESTTFEEANSEFNNWFWQRTRWIKGYIQTFSVHTRTIDQFLKNREFIKAGVFMVVVGGKVFSILVNPLMWILTILYFSFRTSLGPTIETLFPNPVLYMGVFSIVFGNFLYMYYYMIASAKKAKYSLVKWIFLVPLYWIFMSMAGWVAIYRLVAAPHHWSKTKHGLHLQNKQILTPVV